MYLYVDMYVRGRKSIGLKSGGELLPHRYEGTQTVAALQGIYCMAHI